MWPLGYAVQAGLVVVTGPLPCHSFHWVAEAEVVVGFTGEIGLELELSQTPQEDAGVVVGFVDVVEEVVHCTHSVDELVVVGLVVVLEVVH